MEEKTSQKHHSFWAVFSFSYCTGPSFFASDNKNRQYGFTLIELIIDIAILAILCGMLLFLIDPLKQLSKAKDSQRREDFKQIRTASDTFYNDANCYPSTISFGQPWELGNTVYMKKIPEDPNCGSASARCYAYVPQPESACPQWQVLFGKLAATSPSAPACLLSTDCLPENYADTGYNFCEFGGNIDCNALHAAVLPIEDTSTPVTPTPTGGGSSTPTPTIAFPTGTPTPTSPVSGTGIYYCACGAAHVTVCNVTFTVPQGVQYYLNAQCSNACGQPC